MNMGAGKGKTRRVPRSQPGLRSQMTQAPDVDSNQVVDFANFKKQFPKLAGNFEHYPKILVLEKVPDALRGKLEVSEKVHGSNLRLMVALKGFVVGSRRMLIAPDASSKQPKATADYVRNSEWLAQLR